MGSKRKASGETRKKPVEARKTGPERIRAPAGKVPLFPASLFKDRTVLALAAILLLALAIRLLPITFCLAGDYVRLFEFDPYYHMRRVMYTINNFPSVNAFDSYVNYPYGYGIGWPPLFDLAAATLALIVGLGHPGRLTVEVVSSSFPVVLGLLSIVALYFLVKDSMGRRAGVAAAFIMAILPAAIFRTAFGFADHHALEVFLSLALYLCFTRAAAAAREEKPSLSHLPRKPLAYAALAGIAVAAMVFAWDGAPIFIGVVVLYALAQYAYDAFRRGSTEYLSITGAVVSLVALALVAPFAIFSGAGQSFTISALYLSWFHVIYLAGIALFFIAMGGLSRLYEGLKAPWFSTVLTAVAGVALLAVAARLALPQFFGMAEAGVQFLLGQGNVLATIVEVEPLYINNGALSIDIPWAYLSTAGPLAILGLLIFLLTLRKSSLENAEIFLLVWTLVVLVLGVLQKRFVYVLAAPVAVFAGFALYKALDSAGFFRFVEGQGNAAPPKKTGAPSRSREAALTPAAVAVAIVAVLLVLPIMVNAYSIVGSPEVYTADWNEACQWVSENTPKTSYTYSADNGTRPEYGIMSWWDYGNFILYRAERPAVANNFQTGVGDAARFFIAQDEAPANAIMDKRNAKYVMLDYRLGSPWAGVSFGVFENMPYLAGENVSAYHMSYIRPVAYGTETVLDGSDKYYGSMYSRLFDGDGLGGIDRLGYRANGLQHYRLLYTSGGYDPVKVFGYVKGARIEGTASPNAKVDLGLDLVTPGGNKTYYYSTTADAQGAYSITVPYPTSAAVGTTRTGAAYTISSGGSSVQVQVSAGAVDNGDVIAGGKL